MLQVIKHVQNAKTHIAKFLRKLAACLPRASKVVDDVATELEKN